MTILIVDDVPQVVELIRQTILRSGLVSTRAEDVREAHSVNEARLELLRYRPDLMILDEVLPGESPLDLLREPAFFSIPVILISATAQTSSPTDEARQPRVLARLPKWGWGDLDRIAGEIRQLASRTPKKSG